MMHALIRACLAALLVLGGTARAHEMSMAEMQVRETAPGEFIWLWTATNERAPNQVLTPVWPAGCVSEVNTVRCGKAGLQGRLEMQASERPIPQPWSACSGSVDRRGSTP